MKKSRYLYVFADGGCSISTDKLTPDEANEMFDFNSDFEPVAMYPITKAEKLAQGILKLVYGNSKKLTTAGYKLPPLE